MSYNQYGYVVASCPLNETEFTTAATRLNCTEDKYGRNQYTCVPKLDLSAIVEFCYRYTVGIYPKGICLGALSNGDLDALRCGHFTEGCPANSYIGADLYKFPACSQINKEQRCFYADPACPNETESFTTEDEPIPTGSTTLMNAFNTTTNISNTLTTPVEQGSADVGAIIGSVMSVVIVLVIVLAVVFWRRRKRYSRVPQEEIMLAHLENQRAELMKRKMSIDGTEEDQQGSVTKGPRIDIEDDIQTELKANETVRLDQKEKEKELDEREKEKELDKRKIELLPEWGRHVLGEYSTWKTPISDQFSSLSDDEVWVLFCFLCSDSGTPDFTDTDCLDILNEIREWMYDNERVTSEKAQRTLDRLKSRGFIWNQDGVDITEDAKDETVYRVIERRSDRLPVSLLYQYYLSSYTTVVRYLRSRGYTRKSGEKCVIGDYPYCDSLLIRRLQMNILTHVTMEDTNICDEVSQYLNIPLSKVRMSDDKRRAFIEELQQTGECMQYRGGSQDSVQQVKWLWRYNINARPDIVRSCIGLHPHWDIYIINNTAYRKHSQHHDRPPAERCLLYSLLMVEDYTVKVKDESHIKMYNVIRERCFTELPVCEEISAANDHGRIIHVENNVIKFKSDDIRHDVMYTFVTECLVEDSDLKFFLTTASCHVISEYCRLWDYKRSEGERCLYIPEEPDEMYDLFIDGIQLDILTHSAMSDRGIHGRITKRLNVPEEVMKWDIDARRRYVKSSKEQGRKKLYCARGMLVGCAGAGKTTLLKKLQNRETADKDRPTETTVGLEVHEDLFEIESGTLKNYKGNSSVFHSDKQLISMTDFAGQVAYYACHQVYLSRRAFYMLVVDMSKNLTEKVHEHNKDRHDPIGSLFHNWTYDDYIVFWLQCIKTYCDVGKRRISGRETERENSVPVILIASHKDEADSTITNQEMTRQTSILI
ncbi:uncharacterized protein LOC125676813 isoform X2 [Ostrea edulis]|uniref:uncharacterized protein LOC125676813 isoform X2 n=1 Tax=Ostrea edulis TaxID=37623 RepID=UPI0024AE93C7|nr:uncharacterized protein LOC125676813 isoform X2 [Ostrea edulis]